MAEMVNIAFDLKMGTEAVRVALTVPAAPIAARRLLPLFQGIAHQVIDAAVGEAEARGETVSCKAGCGACCRQLVAVSKTEARQLRTLVDAMPEPRRTAVRARFADAVARLEQGRLLDDARRLDALSDDEMVTMNPRYMALGIPCPFLEEESCSIHPQRPVVCREYLVTSSPALCASPAFAGVRPIPLRAHLSRSVVMLEGGEGDYTRVVLATALEWSEAHPDDEPEPRPAAEWIDVVLREMTGRSIRGG
jgi:Fe-S-cluster containining protein